jgi:hypothetical protein
MAFSARQITLVASTPTPLLVQGTTGTDFINIQGSLQDPLPVYIEVASGATVYLGGSDVSATKGMLLPTATPIPLSLYGSSEIPYVFSTGTPVVTVLCGRQ